MSWLGWFLIGWFALGALLSVALIGRKRDPITPGNAVVAILLNAALITLVVAFWPVSS